MPHRRRFSRSFVFCVALGLLPATIAAAGAQDETGTVIPLPAKDRKELEKYLGNDVIGKAVAAAPIAHGGEFYGLRKATWHGTLAKGTRKAPRQIQWKVSPTGSPSDGTWRGEVGSTVRFLKTTNDGSVQITSEVDNDHGVVSRFSPAEPQLLSGMKPGASQKTNIDVKVYDLKDPDDLEHKGNLALTFSYVGAYEVTVPAGTYEAALFKWHYKGKVGPASIEDTQYRFVAKGVGPIVLVELKSISAMLVYSDKTKVGFVLEKIE
jgi:hypothetical protein